MPLCYPRQALSKDQGVLQQPSSKNPRGFFLSKYSPVPSPAVTSHGREKLLSFFAKAAALHFERRKCLCGWTFYNPMTDCSPTAASQHLQHIPPAPAWWSRDGSSSSGRHRARPRSAFCRVGSLAAGNKLTFKRVCLDNRKCKNSTWQVIPFRAALQAWQTTNWHSSSEQQIHTT